jgi:MtN3 and saliva related transmembrane protein
MTLFGTIAGLLGAVSTIPQSIQMLRTKEASQISWIMIVLMCSTTILWLLHAVHVNDNVLALWSSLSAITISILVFAKFSAYKNKSST